MGDQELKPDLTHRVFDINGWKGWKGWGLTSCLGDAQSLTTEERSLVTP